MPNANLLKVRMLNLPLTRDLSLSSLLPLLSDCRLSYRNMGFHSIYVCETLCKEIDEDLSVAELTDPTLTGQSDSSWDTHGGCIGATTFKLIVECISSNAASVMNGVKWAMDFGSGAGNIVLWFLLNYNTIPVYAVEREVHRMEYLQSRVEKYRNRIVASRCMK